MTATLSIVEADLARADHREAVVALLNASADSADHGPSPSSEARARLIPRLREQPHFLTFLACHEKEPAGIAICFCGQSHAQGRPLLYISDFFVLPAHRRRGMGHLLLEAIEQKARALGCCHLILEVHTDNLPARRLYESAGFVASVSPMAVAGTVRLVKPLDQTAEPSTDLAILRLNDPQQPKANLVKPDKNKLPQIPDRLPRNHEGPKTQS